MSTGEDRKVELESRPGHVETLSDEEQRVLLLHALYPQARIPGQIDAGLVAVGMAPGSYAAHNRALGSLRTRQFVDDAGSVTSAGWLIAARLWESAAVRTAIESWDKELLRSVAESRRVEETWRPLTPYVSKPMPELQPTWFNFNGPPQAQQFVDGALRSARLCGLVGAWAGVIQYCSLAVEYTLAEALVANGKITDSAEVPAMGELLAKFGQSFPDASQGMKRLVAAITDYRNTAVHPREPHLRPGEHQSRNVYDLTVKFLGNLKREWFSPKTGAP